MAELYVGSNGIQKLKSLYVGTSDGIKQLGVGEIDSRTYTLHKDISVSTLPYGFVFGSAVVYNNEVHILGANVNGTTNGRTKHYKWDGTSWTSVSTLPYEFAHGSAVVYNNEIHILGGSTTATYNRHYKWDGTSWTSVSTLPYGFCFSGCSAVVYNNEIHALGISNTAGGASYNRHYKWDGTSWTSVSTLPYDFVHGSAVVYNNEIHILGGSTTGTYNRHYKWDGTSWTSVSTLPYGFAYGSAVIYNNVIHILGGDINSSDRTKHYIVYPGYYVVIVSLQKGTKIYGGDFIPVSNCILEDDHLVVSSDGTTLIGINMDTSKYTLVFA